MFNATILQARIQNPESRINLCEVDIGSRVSSFSGHWGPQQPWTPKACRCALAFPRGCRHLMRFPTTVEQLTEELQPNKMTDFLYRPGTQGITTAQLRRWRS